MFSEILITNELDIRAILEDLRPITACSTEHKSPDVVFLIIQFNSPMSVYERDSSYLDSKLDAILHPFTTLVARV